MSIQLYDLFMKWPHIRATFGQSACLVHCRKDRPTTYVRSQASSARPGTSYGAFQYFGFKSWFKYQRLDRIEPGTGFSVGGQALLDITF